MPYFHPLRTPAAAAAPAAPAPRALAARICPNPKSPPEGGWREGGPAPDGCCSHTGREDKGLARAAAAAVLAGAAGAARALGERIAAKPGVNCRARMSACTWLTRASILRCMSSRWLKGLG